jgi:hypothetical protein
LEEKEEGGVRLEEEEALRASLLQLLASLLIVAIPTSRIYSPKYIIPHSTKQFLASPQFRSHNSEITGIFSKIYHTTLNKSSNFITSW